MPLTASAYTQVFTAEFSQIIHSISQTPLAGRTLCVFVYTVGTDRYKAVVIDINGTETGVDIGAPTNVDVGDGDQQFADCDIVGLTADGTDGAVYYMDDVAFQNNIEANTFSIDGSRNITMNTKLEIPTDSGGQDHTAIDRIDDTHLFVVHNQWVGGGGRVNCYILTESGGTLTASSALTLVSDSDNDSKVSCVVLSSTRAFAFYEDDSNGAQVALIDISGANPTLTDGPDQIDGTGSTFDFVSYHKLSGKLSSTRAVISYLTGSSVRLRVIQNNSDTIVIGSSLNDNTGSNRVSLSVADSGKFAVGHRASGTIQTYSVSGNTITSNGDSITLPNNPTPNAPTSSTIAFAQMDGSDYLWVSVHNDTDGTLWAAQIRDSINQTVSVNALTLAGSSPNLTIFNRATLNSLTLAGSAEFLTQQPVALFALTLAGSPEFLSVIPISMDTLTLAVSPPNILVGQAFSMDTLTLAGSPQALTVVPGAIAVTVNTLTLVSSPQAAGVGSPGVVTMSTLTLAGSVIALGRVQVFSFTPAQINNLRLTSHEVTARMTIFTPPNLWTGVVSGVHARGAVDVVYTGGAGALTFVRDYLQLKVGTVPGGDDVARLRVDDDAAMSLSTGTITVDENAVIWLPGLFLSIEHLFPIERINPRIAGGTLFKYYDVAYVDQNEQNNTSPVCLAGCDQVAELVAGSHVFNIDLSDSYATTSGVISSYTLSVAPTLGAVISFNTGTGIGTVTVSQAGYWWAICSCTDSFGNSMERFVLLRAHDSTDTDFIEVQITGYSETGGGGVRVAVEARENVALSDIPDNAIAWLWHENKFDGAVGYVNILGVHDTILFNGYVRSDRSRDDLATGDGATTFELTTVDGLAENLPLRSIPLRLKSSPTDWWQYQLLTTGEAIWFLFRWHSTIPWRHDMIGLSDSFDKLINRRAADFEEGTLFQMANTVGFERGVVARLTCDRLGRLHFVRDTQLLNQADRDAVVSAFDIQEDDVSGVIDTVRDPESTVHTMQLSGFSYSSGGVGTPYISIMPGYRPTTISFSLPDRRGSSFRNITHQLITSQLEADERIGRYFAQANMPIKEFRIPFRGNYLTALTTIPSFGWYELNIANTTLARQLDVDKLRLLCRSIQAEFEQENGVYTGSLAVTAVFEPEAQGPNGIVGNYPSAQPTPADEVIDEVVEPSEMIILSGSVESLLTNPISVEETTWTQFDATAYLHAAIDAWWKVKNATVNPAELIWWACKQGQVVIVDEKAQTTTDVTPATNPPNTWSDATAPTVANVQFAEVISDPWIEDRAYVIAEWQEVDSGDLEWRGWLAYTSDNGTSWVWYDFFAFYTLSDQARIRNVDINGTHILVSLFEMNAAPVVNGDYLRVIRKADFVGTARTQMSGATDPDIEIALEIAYVVTVSDDDSLWYVFGLMNDGFSPVSGIANVIFTTDAGSSWTTLEGDWIYDRCIALRVSDKDPDTSERKHWAVRH